MLSRSCLLAVPGSTEGEFILFSIFNLLFLHKIFDTRQAVARGCSPGGGSVRLTLGRELVRRPAKTAIARAGARRCAHPRQRIALRCHAFREKRPILQVDVDKLTQGVGAWRVLFSACIVVFPLPILSALLNYCEFFSPFASCQPSRHRKFVQMFVYIGNNSSF